MKKKIFGIIISLVISGVLFAERAPDITMNKRVWKLGERIEVKASGLNSSLKYRIGAFKRNTKNNDNPIKTRGIKDKTSGSVFMRLRADQGVVPGKYEFHLYRPDSNNILSKVNLVLKSDEADPDPPVVNPPTSNKNFTTSSATTDLNYADTVKFGSEYSALGYNHLKYVKRVTKSQLSSMLSAKNQMHFHSGHGSSSGSINCTDGNLSTGSLSGKIQTKYSIYCICSAFASSGWSKVMGSNAIAVMGFNKTVTDGSCLNLASKFPDQLKSGQSYAMAWYKSNAAISGHKDRWAMYVKEGSKVVLYKAGGNTPRYQFSGKIIYLNDMIKIDNKLFYSWNYKNFDKKVGLFDVKRVKKRFNKECKWPTKKSGFNSEKAFYKALDALGANLPDEAALEMIIPVEKCGGDGKCVTVAHNISFIHKYGGLKIRNNSIVDYVSVLVGDENKIAIDSKWSEITAVVGPMNDETLSVSKALFIALEDITNVIREPVMIANFEKVYGLVNDDGYEFLVPAFEFIGTKGERFVVNAFTGKMIE